LYVEDDHQTNSRDEATEIILYDAKRDIDKANPSVCLSVRDTPVLYQSSARSTFK